MTIGNIKSNTGTESKKETLSQIIERQRKEIDKEYNVNQTNDMFSIFSQLMQKELMSSLQKGKGTPQGAGEYQAPPKDAKEMIWTTVKKFEGGYSNHKADRGGETNKGITKAVYEEYRREKGLPIQSVKNITDAEVEEIYYNKYFVPSGAADLLKTDPKMAYALYDTSVLYGVGASKKMFSASGGDLATFLNLREQRNYDIVRKNPSQQVFLNGWNNRVAALRQMLLNGHQA